MRGATERKRPGTPDVTISAAGMRIIRLLVGNPPMTVSEMIGETGVTRTAVTEQLHELVAGGFVDQTSERLPGRGRPRYRYTASHAALLLLFASNQRILVPCIWRAVEEVGGNELTQKVLDRVSKGIAEHYQRRVTGRTPVQRLRQMNDLLNEEGCLVEVDEDSKGQLSLRRRSCPFISMFEESRAVCQVDQRVLALVVGAPVRQTTCRHDGAPCCTFELASPNGK